jgi:hypothetical protein
MFVAREWLRNWLASSTVPSQSAQANPLEPIRLFFINCSRPIIAAAYLLVCLPALSIINNYHKLNIFLADALFSILQEATEISSLVSDIAPSKTSMIHAKVMDMKSKVSRYLTDPIIFKQTSRPN